MGISRIVGSFFLLGCNLWGGVVDEPLLKLLDVMQVPHDGTLSSIVAETQKHWIRPAGKERWEIEGELKEKSEIIPLAEELGFIHEMYPLKKEYDYCLLLGAAVVRMEKRVSYMIKLWKEGVRFKEVVFLTGARPLDPAVDVLTDVCKTEGEAARYIWEHADLPQGVSDIPLTLIEVPMIATSTGFRRPTTLDTLNFWMILNPAPGSCLGISNQPYCLYQGAVIDSSLPKEFEFEIVGEAARPDFLKGGILLDTVARWLYQEYRNDEFNQARVE